MHVMARGRAGRAPARQRVPGYPSPASLPLAPDRVHPGLVEGLGPGLHPALLEGCALATTVGVLFPRDPQDVVARKQRLLMLLHLRRPLAGFLVVSHP